MIVTTNGSTVEVQYTATVNGVPTDPTTITVAFKLSGGAWTTATNMVRDALGSYHYDYTPPSAGYYSVLVATTGPARTEAGGVAVLST